MPFIGNKPSAVPLTSADIADGIITSAKIVDGTIVNADINASAAIDSTKLSGVQGKFESQLLHVRDEKSAGVNAGGIASANTFTKRTLNTTLTNEISGASISSSVITLPAGTYYIHGLISGYACGKHKAKLRNTSDSSDTLIGSSERVDYNDVVMTKSFINGRFTIASQKNFEIQHAIETTTDANNLGVAYNVSVVEVYTDVQIWKVA